MPKPNRLPPSIQILGTRVHMVEIPEVVTTMDRWIEEEHDQPHHVVNSGMHGIMEAHKDGNLKSILNAVELFAPDGILVVLLARLKGFPLRKKHTGPELLWEFSGIAAEKHYSFYFYGDKAPTLERLTAKLKESFPNLQIAGCHSPPFRLLTPQEDEAVVRTINEAKPDVLWVGLGMPKQELWIAEHRDRLTVPVLVGAGAAFKLISGITKRAPRVVSNCGFEWLWRFALEPKSVWRRVLIDAPRFVGLVALELSGLRKYR